MSDETGAKRVVANLARLQRDMLQRVVRSAEIVQAMVVSDAQANHPYRDRTTNLTQSIQPGVVVVTPGSVEATVEARMHYASFVEFGTSRSKPYPFMVPAVLRHKDVFVRAVAKALKG